MLTILLVLHPRHKFEYFKIQKWEAQWIQDAREIVYREFDHSYAPAASQQRDRDDRQVANPVSHTTPNCDFVVDLRRGQTHNIFDNLPDLAPMSSDLGNELDCYLAADIEDVKDPLKWWYEHRGAFPHLSLMARDYLSIPGKSITPSFSHQSRRAYIFPATTVDVERVFSQGRLVLSHIRSRLSVQSTRALLCLGAWSQLDLVSLQDIKGTLCEEPEVDGREGRLPNDWDAI